METKTIKINAFDYFEFNHVITSKGIRAVTAKIYPHNNHFGYFYSLYNSCNKINYILNIFDKLSIFQEYIIPGNNEYYISINLNFSIFYVTLPEHNPIQVPTVIFKEFLSQFYKWLQLIESCQIPGIIPESKLNTWSCVPNEYIKPEYWDLLKQQQEQKDNEI